MAYDFEIAQNTMVASIKGIATCIIDVNVLENWILHGGVDKLVDKLADTLFDGTKDEDTVSNA